MIYNAGSQKEKKLTDPKIDDKLYSNHGVIFGTKKGETVAKTEDKDGHILVVGGIGSGKSSCIAIPSLLAWKDRVFAIDIKGELYKNTEGKRDKILTFNPLDENSLGYNPFHMLDFTHNLAQEAQTIAYALVPLPPETKDPFWIKSARSMLAGAILHFHKNFSFIETIIQILSMPVKDLIKEIHNSEVMEARLFVNGFVGMDSKTLSGIYEELHNNIVLYATDKDIRQCLSKKKFITPEDLEKGADIYIIIPENLLRQWKNLLTLIVSQFLTHFEKCEESADIPPILFLLDEFSRLGKIEGIVDGLVTLRSKKITMCIVIQELAQLDDVYGREKRAIICGNCSYKAILNAGDTESQEYFSKLVGTYEKTKITKSRNLSPLGFPGGTSRGETTEEKPIIKPEDFATLTYIVLLVPFPHRFCKVDKKPYYENKDGK